jgi:hypothetical protein
MEDLVSRLGVRWERREMVYAPIQPVVQGSGDD